MAKKVSDSTMRIRVRVEGAEKEIKGLTKRIEEVVGAVTKKDAALKKLNVSMSKTVAHVTNVKKELGGMVANLRKRVAELEFANVQTRKSMAKDRAETKALVKEKNKYMHAAERATDRLDKMKKKQLEANKAAREGRAAYGSLGATMQSFGRTMQAIVGASIFYGLYSGLAGVVRQAREFEVAMVGVAKTTGLTGGTLKRLTENVQEISKYYGNAREHVGEIARLGGQLGIRGTDNLTEFTRVVTELELATNLTSESAATSLARVMKLASEKVETSAYRLANAYVTLGNNFAAQEVEIAVRTLDLAPVLGRFGFPSDVIAGFGTAAALSQVQSQSLATALNKLLIGMDIVAGNLDDNTGGMKALVALTEQDPDLIRTRVAARDPELLVGIIDRMRTFDPLSQQVMLQELGLQDVRTQKALYAIMKLINETYTVAVGARGGNEMAQEVERRRESLYNQVDVATQRIYNALDDLGYMILEKIRDFLVIFAHIAEIIGGVFTGLRLIRDKTYDALNWIVDYVFMRRPIQTISRVFGETDEAGWGDIAWEGLKLGWNVIDASFDTIYTFLDILIEKAGKLAGYTPGVERMDGTDWIHSQLQQANWWLNDREWIRWMRGATQLPESDPYPLTLEEYRDLENLPYKQLQAMDRLGKLPEGWLERMVQNPPQDKKEYSLADIQKVEQQFLKADMMRKQEYSHGYMWTNNRAAKLEIDNLNAINAGLEHQKRLLADEFMQKAPAWITDHMPDGFEFTEEATKWLKDFNDQQERGVIEGLKFNRMMEERNRLRDDPRYSHGYMWANNIAAGRAAEFGRTQEEAARIKGSIDEFQFAINAPSWFMLEAGLAEEYYKTDGAKKWLETFRDTGSTEWNEDMWDVWRDLQKAHNLSQVNYSYGYPHSSGITDAGLNAGGFNDIIEGRKLRLEQEQAARKAEEAAKKREERRTLTARFLMKAPLWMRQNMPQGFETTDAAHSWLRQHEENQLVSVDDIREQYEFGLRRRPGYSHGYQVVNTQAVEDEIDIANARKEGAEATRIAEARQQVYLEALDENMERIGLIYQSEREFLSERFDAGVARRIAQREQQEQIKNDILSNWRSVAQGIAESLGTLATGAYDLKDVFMSVLTQIRDQLIRQFITQPVGAGLGDALVRGINGSFFGSGGGAAGGPVPVSTPVARVPWFPPGLAEGGTVIAPGLALVGERGPEFLSLPRAAQVTPLHKAGGDQIVVNYNIASGPGAAEIEAVLDKRMPEMMDTFENVMAQRTQGNSRFAQVLNG